MAEILDLLISAAAGQGFLVFLIALYVGVILACAVAIYERRTMGDFIRTLIGRGALSAEKALTLAELGYEKSGAVKRGLRGKGIFAGTVYEASEEVEFDREDHALPIYRAPFDEKKARFYVPEVLKYRAEVRFEKKGTHIMALVLGALLFGALLAVVLIFRNAVVEQLRNYIALMSA